MARILLMLVTIVSPSASLSYDNCGEQFDQPRFEFVEAILPKSLLPATPLVLSSKLPT